MKQPLTMFREWLFHAVQIDRRSIAGLRCSAPSMGLAGLIRRRDAARTLHVRAGLAPGDLLSRTEVSDSTSAVFTQFDQHIASILLTPGKTGA
jgi:hypothetical protein